MFGILVGPMYSLLGKFALYGPTGPEPAPVGNGEGGIPLNICRIAMSEYLSLL